MSKQNLSSTIQDISNQKAIEKFKKTLVRNQLTILEGVIHVKKDLLKNARKIGDDQKIDKLERYIDSLTAELNTKSDNYNKYLIHIEEKEAREKEAGEKEAREKHERDMHVEAENQQTLTDFAKSRKNLPTIHEEEGGGKRKTNKKRKLVKKKTNKKRKHVKKKTYKKNL